MNIRYKIISIVGGLILLISVVIVNTVITANRTINNVMLVKDKTLLSSMYAEDLNQELSRYQVESLIPLTGVIQVGENQETIDRHRDQFIEILEKYKSLNPEDVDAVNTIVSNYNTFIHSHAGDDVEALTNTLENDLEQLKQVDAAQTNQSLSALLDKSKSSAEESIIVGVLILIVSVVGGFLLTRSIVNPVNRLITATSAIAQGNLRNEIQLKSRDEIGELARNFEQMRNRLAAFIRASQTVSLQVAASTEQLHGNSATISNAIMDMSKALQVIATGANEQLHSTEETARAVNEMAIGILRISDLTNDATDRSVQTKQEAYTGKELLHKAVKRMELLNGVIQQFHTTVNKLDAHSQSINQIVDVIKVITTQTHLLALNAGIEAARAGDQGKSFAVVANEMKKLSEQTNTSSNHIFEIIQWIQADTKLAVAMVESGADEAEQGMQTLQYANEAFNNITTATVEISSQLQEISSSAEQLSANSEEISASVFELSAIARDAYVQSDNVASVSQGQLEAIMEIADSSDWLHRSAKELQTQIEKYKV
ncbi:methyl-accepting chemotaxis protein [Paenibacillus cellulosilyticus]|uniref:Methyl-accepting chemotaxis protein n=1 Tax=Paenibacillus cellulosilyticus TaxID=375489 RepID=A0A2V2YWB3_9BACL|nr:methyl-accepting chemotaxis protein [Paenibacillus cellulosilyticus]PWW05737.1 methyl-accepting chemotaxis protein [Paenibacillus cellulosilyticus]QKS45250.1 methyl-accepting chemotaxis protein [Paenibacillus cellulosilyticus]